MVSKPGSWVCVCVRTCSCVCVYCTTTVDFFKKSKTELKLKLPVCYFHEASFFVSNPLMYLQLLFFFFCSFFFFYLCGKFLYCSAVRGNNPLIHTVASIFTPPSLSSHITHPSLDAVRVPRLPPPHRRRSPASSPRHSAGLQRRLV